MSARTSIAILPLGATEQHGAHLPAETDSIIAEGVARRAADRLAGRLDVHVLPVEAVGYSIEHGDHPSTRSRAYGEAIERWIALGAGQRAAGIGKFVMLNAHGGNSPLMTIAATEMRVRHGLLAVATSWTRFGWPEGLVSASERTYGIHGGLVETSVMLVLAPERVTMPAATTHANLQEDLAGRYRHLRAYGPHAFGWKMSDLSPAGTVGDARAATAHLGERLLDHAVGGFTELLLEIDDFDPPWLD